MIKELSNVFSGIFRRLNRINQLIVDTTLRVTKDENIFTSGFGFTHKFC